MVGFVFVQQAYAAVPVISSVSFSPSSGLVKVDEIITMTIVSDGTGYSPGEIIINSSQADDGSFTDNGDNTYSVTYTVVDGDEDIADDAQIPISVVLSNESGDSDPFTTSPSADDSPAIVVNLPGVQFSIPNDFYGPNTLIISVGTTTATIVGYFFDSTEGEPIIDTVIQRSDTGEIYGNDQFETPWISEDPGLGNLGIIGYFYGFFGNPNDFWWSDLSGQNIIDNGGGFVDGVTYTYTLRFADVESNLTEVSDSFTWDSTAPTNQDTVFPTSLIRQLGVSIPIVSSGDATNQVWLVPADATYPFTESATSTKAVSGTSTSIMTPAIEGSYKLFVIDAVENVSDPSTAGLITQELLSSPVDIGGTNYQPFDPADLPILFSIDGGTSVTSTTQLTSLNNVVATSTNSAGTIQILIPFGTQITKSDDSEFDLTDVSASDVAGSFSASSVSSDIVIIQGAASFGISGTVLYFSSPITVKIPVTSANGTTLSIKRSADGGTTWITTGLTAASADICTNGIGSNPVSTAVVTGGFIIINTCQASVFAGYTHTLIGGGGAPTQQSQLPQVTLNTGGSSLPSTPATTTPQTSLQTQQQLLLSLIAQLKTLILQAKAQGLTISAAAQALVETTPSFTRDLQFGMNGEDVRQIQIYLNTHGFTVSSAGFGSSGKETLYFGPATQSALVQFQKTNNIFPAAGYFGPKTRAYVNLHP